MIPGTAAPLFIGASGSSAGFKSASSVYMPTSGNGLSQPMPPSWAPGDIFIFMLGLTFTYASNTPSGWTLVSNYSPQTSCRLKFYYRVAQSGDTSPVLNETSGAGSFGTAAGYMGVILAYTGLTSRADDNQGNNASGSTLAYGTTASLSNNSIAVAAFYKNANTTTTPDTGWVSRISTGMTNGSTNRTISIADTPLPVAGAGPSGVHTFGTSTGENLRLQFNLNP